MAIDLLGTSDNAISTGTTAQRPSTAASGTLYYNTTTAQIEVYSAGAWQAPITGVVTPLPGSPWYPYSTASFFFGAAHSQAGGPTPNPVVLGGGTILASNGASGAYISADGGVTWTLTGSYVTTATYWSGFSYGNGLFIAMQRDTASSNAASNPGTTGTTWTNRGMPVGQFWQCTAYNGTTFVAVGKSSSGTATTQAASSTNGTTWTSRTMSSSATWDSVCWDGTKFIALPADASACNVSTDGITWSTTMAGTMPGTPIGNIATDGAGTCVVGTAGGYMYTTDHGTTWTNRSVNAITLQGTHAYYANGYFYLAIYTTGTATGDTMYVFSTANIGKAPTPIVSAQPSVAAGANNSVPWVFYTGSNTIAATRNGIVRA